MVRLPFRSKRHADKANRGATAESLAGHYLSQQGLKIVARNYRTQRGEIDIIARDGETLVFVEVRLRSNPGFGGAAHSIDARKQARLISAAQHYLLQTGLTDAQPCRFDAICLSTIATSSAGEHSPQDNESIDWIRDAFRPEA
ncbi:MAG: YraN family protein [Gammaproteobacteria bacterium]|nr:YraN family protein [Gammaproteobacteria bacterium]MBQ0838254.1 YraN family protein [Gammaproteobacteria bacterium]